MLKKFGINKKMVIIIVKSVIIGVLIISTMIFARDIYSTNVIKKEVEESIKLSDEEKNKLNYNELIEDIVYLEKGKGYKYAKRVEEKKTNNASKKNNGIVIPLPKKEYQGDGYYIKSGFQTDAYTIDFYTDEGKEIWGTSHSAWSYDIRKEEIKEKIKKETFYLLLVIVITTDFSICIVKCMREKEKIQNDQQ